MTRDSSLDGVRLSAREMYQNFIDTLNRMRQSIEDAVDMDVIYDQMRIFFRDESKYSFVINKFSIVFY